MKFDQSAARLFDTFYRGNDFVKRRQVSFDALCPVPGDTILDLGCGNGLFTAQLARSVGPDGSVAGIDPVEDMRKAAAENCEAFPWVSLSDGSANNLPFHNDTFSKAASLQVFEYLNDIPAALAEAARVIKPGGRFVIADIHYDSLIWASDDPARMRQISDFAERHIVERRVAALLPSLLPAAGFDLEKMETVTLNDHVMQPDGLARMMLHLTEADSSSDIAPDLIDAWAQEQRDRAASNRFFFSITQFVATARRR